MKSFSAHLPGEFDVADKFTIRLDDPLDAEVPPVMAAEVARMGWKPPKCVTFEIGPHKIQWDQESGVLLQIRKKSMNDTLHLANRSRRPEMGWTQCPMCSLPFLTVVGVRARCPKCIYVFSVAVVTTAPVSPITERSTALQKLERMEIFCARTYAESLADHATDTVGWLRAWIIIKGLRFGQKIQFQDPQPKAK
jgi:hypothetical protein